MKRGVVQLSANSLGFKQLEKWTQGVVVVLTSFSSRRFLCFLFIGLLLCVRTKSGRQSAEVKSDYIYVRI